jgi:hypothetical protein
VPSGGKRHALGVIAARKGEYAALRWSGSIAESADAAATKLETAGVLQALWLDQTRRPAISSRNGELSSGVRRAWPSSRIRAARIMSMFIGWFFRSDDRGGR